MTTYNPFDEIIKRLDNIESMLIELRGTNIQAPTQTPSTPPQPFIKGIHELASFLKVSTTRAQQLKNEGVFPYWQDGRTLLFDPEKVKIVMSKKQ